MRKLLCSLAVVATVSAVGGGESLTRNSPQATQPACAVKFDGVYYMTQPNQSTTLRFFADGSVADTMGADDGSLSRLARRTQGVGQFGRYVINGCSITIETTFMRPADTVRVGTIAGDHLKLTLQARPGSYPSRSEEFAFAPADFAAIRRAQQIAESAAREQREAAIEVALGTATMNEECNQVTFKAASTPVRLPAGAKELAVRVTGEGLTVAVSGGRLCATGGIKTRTCNEYAIINGQPRLSRQTSIFGCKGGVAFRPGSYVLTAGAKKVPFVVR